ncbi:MAG: DNA recombination protein RmuC [Verrucomicrobia bacterium]|nr:DNA recombination protein RmuC [Verrucomicrobiota bacterium]NDE63555.1 DNA recombination protein RmuC [Chlamydiota bacterium]
MEYLSIVFGVLTLILLSLLTYIINSQKKTTDLTLRPLHDRLSEIDQQMRSMERFQTIDTAKMGEEIRKIHQTDQYILKEMHALLQAFKKPDVRGFWGEVQLKRLIEAAGMLPYTDFLEQEVIGSEEGKLRPDVIIRLPKRKQIIIDVKTPMESYLEALSTDDPDVRLEKMTNHVRRIKDHMDSLKRKKYAKLVEGFEFVLLFLPTEALFSSALQLDPTILEYGIKQDVLIVTPTSLIALLKTVALSWKEDRLRENLEKVKELGQELHKRLQDASVHIQAMSKALNQTVEAHNKFIGSMEKRVLSTARKFEEMGASGEGHEIRLLEELEVTAKYIPLEDPRA